MSKAHTRVNETPRITTYQGELRIDWDIEGAYSDIIDLTVGDGTFRLDSGRAETLARAILGALKEQQKAEEAKTKDLEDRIVKRVLNALKNERAAKEWVERGLHRER